MIFLNTRLKAYMKKLVLAYEILHEQEHRDKAKVTANKLQEFTLFNIKDTTEYEANTYASHLLLENDEVYALAKKGYDFNIPYAPDRRFFKKIRV